MLSTVIYDNVHHPNREATLFPIWETLILDDLEKFLVDLGTSRHGSASIDSRLSIQGLSRSYPG